MHFICKLSRIMGESHAFGSKIVNSRIQTNFSRLTDNSEHGECNCLKTFEKSSEHLRNSLTMLEIGWKSFLKSLAHPVLKSSKIFRHLWLSAEIIGKSSEVIGNLQRFSEVFRKLRQTSEVIDKASEIQVLWRRKISRILLKKSWQV